ncbi:hypothetical protein Gotur_027332 [Gossypium turneri]
MSHTFHLPCDECTITLENVALQFDLLVDEPIVTGLVVVGGWSGICEQLLGKVATKTRRLERNISTQLGISRVGHIVLKDSWAWYRLSFLRPRVDALYTFPLMEHSRKSCRTTRGARRYPILLDQQSKADNSSMHPAEYLANPNIWHMNVPLIVYAKVEIYESDRVMRQFEFRQTILPSPQYIEPLYKVDLRGRIDEDWPTFHGQYLNIWQPFSTTCHGLDIMKNHIFYLRRQGLGNVVLEGQDYNTPNPYPSLE